MEIYDVCIIGGGAAGLAAAASLDRSLKSCILEKNRIPGRKIMATGGGRCNITNHACENKDMALDFFRSLGLETYCDEEGRYYPYSNQASDVVKLLLAAAEATKIITEFQAVKAEAEKDLFIISDAKGQSIGAKKLLVAMGGKAAPQFGTTGDGYAIARSFGHTIKKVYPILTGIVCGDFSDLKGVRAKGSVSLFQDGIHRASETGEIQFTEDGISGICVFNLTPYIVSQKEESLDHAMSRYHLMLDLAPDFTLEQIAQRKSSFGILSDKLAARVGMDEIKAWRLPVKGVKGWKNAQCTAGGVALEEIHESTMESKRIQGLYFAGEILDVQGPCGGYNLQNAWETGLKAAHAINQNAINRKKK